MLSDVLKFRKKNNYHIPVHKYQTDDIAYDSAKDCSMLFVGVTMCTYVYVSIYVLQ